MAICSVTYPFRYICLSTPIKYDLTNSRNLCIFYKMIRNKQSVELLDLLKCNEDEILFILNRYPYRTKRYCNAIEVIKILQDQNVSLNHIKKHLWVLSYSSSVIRSYWTLLENYGAENFLPVLKLARLKKLKSSEGEAFLKDASSRITYLAQHLGTTEVEMVHYLEQHSRLLSMEFSRIIRVMEILKKANVNTSAILKDLWVFRHNENVMVERIDRAKAVGMPLKTWMLRCPEKVFNTSLARWNDKISVLGNRSDVIEYLAERLDCSKEFVLILAEKNPQLTSVNAPKIKLMLDFLYKRGFTPYQVWHCPRVLNNSISTVQKRLNELDDINYHPSSLHTVCTTSKVYRRMIQWLKTGNKCP